MTHYDDCIAAGHDSDSDEDIAARSAAVALDRAESAKLYYAALKSLWLSLSGTTAERLAVINAMLHTDNVTPWWQANGYSSPFNENDIVAGGII